MRQIFSLFCFFEWTDKVSAFSFFIFLNSLFLAFSTYIISASFKLASVALLWFAKLINLLVLLINFFFFKLFFSFNILSLSISLYIILLLLLVFIELFLFWLLIVLFWGFILFLFLSNFICFIFVSILPILIISPWWIWYFSNFGFIMDFCNKNQEEFLDFIFPVSSFW